MVDPPADRGPTANQQADNDPSTHQPTFTITEDLPPAAPASKHTFSIRFIIKHAGKSTISLPLLLQQFMLHAHSHQSSITFYDHHDNTITPAAFPTQNDFKTRFDGGATGSPGSYYEKVFNGPSTVTWFSVKSPIPFLQLAQLTRSWLRENGVFIDLIKDYFGPHEIVGTIFGLHTKYTHRDTLLRRIQEIVNPNNQPDFNPKSDRDEDDMVDSPTIPFKPELKIAPYYYTQAPTDKKNAHASPAWSTGSLFLKE